MFGRNFIALIYGRATCARTYKLFTESFDKFREPRFFPPPGGAIELSMHNSTVHKQNGLHEDTKSRLAVFAHF